MFTPADRRALRDDLIARARRADDVVAAAVVGSAARDAEDDWSDIDLAVRLREGLMPNDVVDEWTAVMYEVHRAVDHLDVWSGSALYRVYLLDSSLQVDLSFWPFADFTATTTAFRLVFGDANESTEHAGRDIAQLVGTAWLYALHVRSSIARGRVLQAVYMLNGLRDQIVALACVRHDLPSHEGRGVDDLPVALTCAITDSLPHGSTQDELRTAFAKAADLLLAEARHIDASRAARIESPLQELVRTA